MQLRFVRARAMGNLAFVKAASLVFVTGCILQGSWASKPRSPHQKEARLMLKPAAQTAQITLEGNSKIRLGEVYLSGLSGLRGQEGERGPPGRRGLRGPTGEKGDKGDSCVPGSGGQASLGMVPLLSDSEVCDLNLDGGLRFDKKHGKLRMCNTDHWREIQLGRRGEVDNNPSRKSCLEILFEGESEGDGMYWINPTGKDDTRNAFRAYCDMTTAGGGWTLAAKITHDYSWVCPESGGQHCLGSKANPIHANLFHEVHQRDSVDLSIANDIDAGVHINNSIIRLLFVSGRQSVRFTFVTSENGWHPSEDAYAAFNAGQENTLFQDGTWGKYYKEKIDYTWNVLKHERKNSKFDGKIICWGNKVKESYRFYDHGLHLGSPASKHKPCLLDHNNQEVMLKSHYAVLESPPDKARWDMAQFGFLGAEFVQVPNKRIAIWVR